MTSPEPLSEDTRITKIKATNLDQLIQVLEISFIFLVCWALITLVDASFVELDLYVPIANDFLGDEGFGNLDGGNFEQIVRVTLIFNLMLFAFSLVFGLWMRRTRDGWTWSQLGYTINTPNYEFKEIVSRAVVLGLLAIVVWFTIMTLLVLVVTQDFTQALLVHTFQKDGILFNSHQLNAEFYFGWVEMGFIWPLSAGFFFFAYVHNSFKARFPQGIANLISSIFYVIYLAFFFMLLGSDKLARLPTAIINPMFWGPLLVFFITLYISFSAFSETESIVLPFLLNFVFNFGLTLLKAFNSLFFATIDPTLYFLMLVPFVLTVLVIILWVFLRKEDFSTLKIGYEDLKNAFSKETRKDVSILYMIGIILLFFFLSFFVPGILEHVTARPDLYSSIGYTAIIFALTLMVILGIAIIVLTYEPTKVYDVLLVKTPDGIPIATRQKLFQSDEVLISGFFTAISSVSKELDEDHKADLRSIKRGEREIIIEDGVFTRIIALADRDQSKIRQAIVNMQRRFESIHSKALSTWIGDRRAIPEAKELVESIGKLEIRFDIPQQTRWIGVLTLILTPLMIVLISFI
ncbi:MAG: hypothetical protein ACXAC8_08630 [Candidatus Hodarchaeales archaeon]|jgi:hypothetical protein